MFSHRKKDWQKSWINIISDCLSIMLLSLALILTLLHVLYIKMEKLYSYLDLKGQGNV